jgi:hypothetical protein
MCEVIVENVIRKTAHIFSCHIIRMDGLKALTAENSYVFPWLD